MRLIVPTFNSARWILILLDRYRALGLEPLYCVDSRSTDMTEELLRASGADVKVVSFEPPRVEALVPQLADMTTDPWILRMDDDEIPSLEMVEWIAGDFSHSCACVGFVRRYLRLVDDSAIPGRVTLSVQYIASASWGQNGEDRQYRLYRKDRVAYTTEIHTPGFTPREAIHAPVEAAIWHFEAFCRSREERLEKRRGYDKQRPGAGSGGTGRYELPEDLTWDIVGTVEDEEAFRLARLIVEAK